MGEKSRCSEEISQEVPTGKSWLISSCSEPSPKPRRSRMVMMMLKKQLVMITRPMLSTRTLPPEKQKLMMRKRKVLTSEYHLCEGHDPHLISCIPFSEFLK